MLVYLYLDETKPAVALLLEESLRESLCTSASLLLVGNARAVCLSVYEARRAVSYAPAHRHHV